jgi:hypothetical protein
VGGLFLPFFLFKGVDCALSSTPSRCLLATSLSPRCFHFSSAV